jgi:phytoene dehydrogenase-like protein
MSTDVVVIGSGIGGLACAGKLAARGRRVVVLEQASGPGGYLASFARGAFRFDAAVDHIAGLGTDGLITHLLQELGVEQELVPLRLDPVRLTRFPGLTVPVDASLPAYVERLHRIFPGERAGITAFFRRAEAIYADLQAVMEAVAAEQDAPERASEAMLRYGAHTYAQLLAEDIRDPKLAAVLSDRCPFLGAAPTRVAATRMVGLVMSYFRSGAYRPAGGHGRLAELLVSGIRRRGGEVHVGRAAHRIVVEGGRCTRVLAEDGADFPAGAVVSNADFDETFGRLLGAAGERARLAGRDRVRSPSFFIAYAGVRREGLPAASSIGSFGTFDLTALLERYVPFAEGDPLGITIPSVEDPGVAPAGHDALAIHELVPPGDRRRWDVEKQACLDRLLAKAEAVLPGLRGRLVHVEAATPGTLERWTRNRGGAAYGWEQGPVLQRIRHGIPNLHLVGHWTEIGGGVLAAAFSGLRAAVRLLTVTA